MKKLLLLTPAALAALTLTIGCTTVEHDDAPAVSRSTTTSSREVSTAPYSPATSATSTRSTTVQSY